MESKVKMSEETPTITPKQFSGMKVNVENPKGSVRKGINAQGIAWETPMTADYGYIPSATGGDGEGLDAYLGPDEGAPNVHIVHQNNDDGSYDEDKAMVGWPNADDARASYLAHTGGKADRLRSMTTMPLDRFKSMLTKAEPDSAHWKKKHGRPHATTALMARIEVGQLGFNLILPADAPEGMLLMARARLAKCPSCKSFDVTRQPARSADEGPMDKCDKCGHAFPHKTGTVTAAMHEMGRQDGYGEGAEPEVPGTTETAGWTDADPPVLDADGNPIDEDDEGGLDDEDQAMLAKAGIFTSRLAQSLTL